MLSDEGFLVVRDLFSHSELGQVAEALGPMPLDRKRGGVRGLIRLHEVRRLAQDSRLLQLAAEFVSPSPFPFRATLFHNSPIANWLVAWHQDTVLPLTRRVDSQEWGPWTTKAGVLHASAPAAALSQVVALRIHLDDSNSENGPLRVLPNTHTDGVLTLDEIERLSHQVTAVECLASAGGVVAMRPLLVHASSKSRQTVPRRVLHIEYAACGNLGVGIELAVA